MRHVIGRAAAVVVFLLAARPMFAQAPLVAFDLDRDSAAAAGGFAIASERQAAAIYVAPGNPETVRVAADAFASDVEKVTGTRPRVLTSLAGPVPAALILVGVLGHSPEIDALVASHRIETTEIAGKWESAVTAVVNDPVPGVRSGLVIAGSDRRGAAFALFTLSRQMGVSPWSWWADVPVAHHDAVYVQAGLHIQAEPSVEYRGIFLNDEDWGLRVWAKKMDPAQGNFGPHTYEHIFELLLRLHANSLWPAMHPGSLAFNAVPENAKLADKWGIVMGSSHSEALLRNNVGEWNEAAPPKGDGPWNYQTNSAAMNAYWAKRLAENGAYENFYTVGLRGVHDSGLEATGTAQVKATLVEDAMAAQRGILTDHIAQPIAKIPQVIWLYKESLDLYRAGMQVPDDVTLGWTDDNYGYLRELPNAAEQRRAGGSGVYYHVSYWGSPHDYLWLCTTPPALIREEMTKAYDHNARRYWVLNVGDLKPAEIDIDYFMQLAWDEPATAALTQREFLRRWAAEQFPTASAPGIADAMTRYYQLNFIRKPEFMGFNGYNDGVQRTAFNPQAWGEPVDVPAVTSGAGDNRINLEYRQSSLGQNQTRSARWASLSSQAAALGSGLAPAYASAYFELIGYPIDAAAAMNRKSLWADLTYLDAHNHDEVVLVADTKAAREAYDTVQALTAKYNALEGGKWAGMMSAAPRERHVFEMPRTATAADAEIALPASWGAGAPVAAPISPGFVEQDATVSMNAAHFARAFDGAVLEGGQPARWKVLPDLGISGASVVFGEPGLLANAAPAALSLQSAPWLEYDFTTTSSGEATLMLHLLPTFAVDSTHRLRYAVAIDGHPALQLDAAATPTATAKSDAGDGPKDHDWPANVLRNSAIRTLHLSTSLSPGAHTVRLYYVDPGVVFEHLVLTFAGAPPAYPVPPETSAHAR